MKGGCFNMKICPNCLKKFNDDFQLCSECGSDLVDEETFFPELTEEDFERGMENSLMNHLEDVEDMEFLINLERKYVRYPFVKPLLNMVSYDKEFREKALSWENLRDRFKNIKIINQGIYEEVKSITNRDFPNTDDDWIKLYSNFVAVVDDLTNHKLSVSEIMNLQDILDDTLRGFNPKIALQVEPNDAGRVLIGLISNLRTTVGVLTLKEKRWLACAVIVLTYVGKYDERQDRYVLGFYDFSSIEDFSLKYNCGFDSSFFMTYDSPIRYDETKPFGFSKENPILTFNVHTAYMYLRALGSREGKVVYKREGSLRGIFGEILDRYKIMVKKNKDFGMEEEVKYLYINSYATENSYDVPEGFVKQ